jgi:N-acetylmuramoyl-L-alanine amidase
MLSCATLPVLAARTKPSRRAELTPWEQAERGRETLEAIPQGSRTRADYTKAIDGFRTVYHNAPGDMHAAESVNAVAELLAEQGRETHDAKLLKAAVGQYEFLRRQYPGSSLRVGALLSEGQIFENDLHDTATAKEAYALLVELYPRNEMAEEAKAGLESLKQGTGHRVQDAGLGARSAGNTVTETAARPQGIERQGIEKRTDNAPSEKTAKASGEHAAPSSFVPMPTTGEETTESAGTRGRTGPAATATAASNTKASDTEASNTQEQSAPPMHVANTSGRKRGQLAQVTGIRHWSTPDYTRVAIDLGDDVTYEAARVPNPDRIYFDLHGTRLAHDLVGKSFAVTDDGFLKRIRAAQFSNDMTRVVLDVNDVTEYSAFLLPNPYRLIIDIHGGSRSEPPAPTTIGAVQHAATPAPTVPNTRAVKTTSSFDVAALSAQPGRVEATSQPTSKPIAAVVADQSSVGSTQGLGAAPVNVAAGTASVAPDVAVAVAPRKTTRSRGAKSAKTSQSAKVTKDTELGVPARAAVPTADGQTSLVRALGLKIGRIVIDPGHGGHDSGTLGVDGIEEKDVVLDVALRLGRLLHDRLGSEIIYTRSDDTFVPLETRTAIANKAQADLFLSIHANSSVDRSARGVETYYLNFTSSPDALQTAARENAVSDESIYQLSDLVKKIALKDKIAESREFAADVEQGLYGGLQKGNVGLKNRGVKKAPFVVLIGANMPSVLAEISFVTNPKDAHQLQDPDYRERVAESLYRGVAKYEEGLSGMKLPTERASRAE